MLVQYALEICFLYLSPYPLNKKVKQIYLNFYSHSKKIS